MSKYRGSPWVSQDISFDGLKVSGVPHVGFSDAFLVVHSCYASGAGSIFHLPGSTGATLREPWADFFFL